MGVVRLIAACFALAVAVAGPAAAQDKYPSRSIKILVPYAPGGATDIVARVIADSMRQSLGQSVIVENKPGAFGIVALDELAKSKPDGYTLMVGNVSTNQITPIIYKKKMSFDYDKSVVPVNRLADLPAFLLTTTKNFPPTTVADFVAYAKKQPGQLKYATVGYGSFPHYDMIMFEKKAGLSMIDVPLKGGASEVVTNMANGDIQSAFLNVATTAPLIHSGNLRPLAVVSSTRLPDYPNVPTMAEVGYAGIGTEQWQTLFARAGTPKAVLDVLHNASTAALHSEQAKKVFAPQYIHPIPSKSPEEAAVWIKEDAKKWEAIVKTANLNIQ